MRLLRALLGLSIPLAMGFTTPTAADDAAERVIRGYSRAMVVISECDLDVPQPVFLRLLDYGKDLQERMGVDDATVERLVQEETLAFDAANSSCDLDDDVVAGVLGFIQEQASILGMDSGLGVRDADTIDMLGGLFVLVATAERCEIALPPPVAAAIGRHAEEMQKVIGMSEERAENAYQSVLRGLQGIEVDCSAGGDAMNAVNDLIATYRDTDIQ